MHAPMTQHSNLKARHYISGVFCGQTSEKQPIHMLSIMKAPSECRSNICQETSLCCFASGAEAQDESKHMESP